MNGTMNGTTKAATRIRLTEAQMCALETAGLFEAPEGDEVLLAAAIAGRTLTLAPGLAAVVNDLSNAADELTRDLTDEPRAWAKVDARVLANLYVKMLRAEAGR